MPSPRLLIVDDQRSNIDVLRDILQDYDRAIALNGEQALKVARSKKPPDLILLDIMMPEMDGYEVCTILKNDPATRDIPIIFVTAKREVADETRGLQLGAVDYITKPFNASIVRHRIGVHLELKRHRDRLEELVKERTQELVEARNIAESRKTAAEDGVRAKNEFLAIISDELRNPLNSIIGFSSFLGEPDLPQTEREQYLEIINGASSSLLGLINEMIELAKVEAREVQLQPEPFDLVKLLQGVVKEFSPQAEKKGLTMTLELPEGLPEMLTGDAKRLQQVLRHLLKNAVGFTNHGSISLAVERQSQTEIEERIHFMVRDTGIGIPLEKQEIIFQEFTQLELAFRRSHGGLGLGLTICKRFVPLMGGTLWVESAENKGSTFHFTAVFQKEAVGS
ncbi:MAG: Hybrid sensor histidine kinase/response regulator [Magnetococcales bacterium]|nr:Hybrid sensor histidine kinase/response regulator [Magnetococcales bacterium]HIJ84665.1 response regulator [Magnetococcales bacterium]